MATSPVFVTSIDELKSKMRLSGLPSSGDGDAQFDEAVLLVRTGLYRELGATVIDSVLAIPFTENPVDDQGVRRATASSIEVKWVRAELMRLLPMMFIDGNANQRQVYHDEAAFREASQRQLDDERRRLMNDVEIGLELLRQSSDPGSDQQQIIADSVEPDSAPRPGDTVVPWHLRGGSAWTGGNV